MFTRRDFLKALGLAAATAAIPKMPAGVDASPVLAEPELLELGNKALLDLGLGDFVHLKLPRFHAEADGGAVMRNLAVELADPNTMPGATSPAPVTVGEDGLAGDFLVVGITRGYSIDGVMDFRLELHAPSARGGDFHARINYEGGDLDAMPRSWEVSQSTGTDFIGGYSIDIDRRRR